MQAFEEAIKGPFLLDLCEHQKERHECELCKKKLKDMGADRRRAALQTVLADMKDNPTPRGPVPRKKYENA